MICSRKLPVARPSAFITNIMPDSSSCTRTERSGTDGLPMSEAKNSNCNEANGSLCSPSKSLAKKQQSFFQWRGAIKTLPIISTSSERKHVRALVAAPCCLRCISTPVNALSLHAASQPRSIYHLHMNCSRELLKRL